MPASTHAVRLLTVIIPTYNRHDELCRAIHHLYLEAKFVLDEVELLIGDNSDVLVQEKNLRLVNCYRKCMDITYIPNLSNLGFSANVFNALPLASSLYTLLLSDDDRLCKGSLDVVLSTLKSLRSTQPNVNHVLLCPYLRGGSLSDNLRSDIDVSPKDFLLGFRSRLLLSSVVFPSVADCRELSAMPYQLRANLYPHILMSSPARASFRYTRLSQPLTIVSGGSKSRWSVYQVTSDLFSIMHSSSLPLGGRSLRGKLFYCVSAWSLLLALKYTVGWINGTICVSEVLRLAVLTRDKAFFISWGFYTLAILLSVKRLYLSLKIVKAKTVRT
ncbi:glycosyltransferase family 2 protein [Synechococcus sp. CCY9202]|uniref:glycosyltransferase family 2 protein n=1 Tax=Synechococcus sp. CCY9202 TaxID=174698 RepID=UPI003A4C8146